MVKTCNARTERKQWNNTKGGPANKQTKYPQCATCGKMHSGVCFLNTRKCYNCRKEGHLARNCPTQSQALPLQNSQNMSTPAQLHQMQAATEGTSISQGRLEAPPTMTNARVYSLTKEDVANASTVVTGQLLIYNQYVVVLFDTGVTHSFVSTPFMKKLDIPLRTLEDTLQIRLCHRTICSKQYSFGSQTENSTAI